MVIMMSVVVVLQKDTIQDWGHVIEFLKLWIQQNDLQIIPNQKI